MVNKCCVGNCDNQTELKAGVTVHAIPFRGNDDPEAKRRRRRWIEFVEVRRDEWTPGNTSSVCSDHFRPEDFERMYSFLPGQEKPSRRQLRRDEFGVCVWPTIQPPKAIKKAEKNNLKSLTEPNARARRSLKRKVSQYTFRNCDLTHFFPQLFESGGKTHALFYRVLKVVRDIAEERTKRQKNTESISQEEKSSEETPGVSATELLVETSTRTAPRTSAIKPVIILNTIVSPVETPETVSFCCCCGQFECQMKLRYLPIGIVFRNC